MLFSLWYFLRDVFFFFPFHKKTWLKSLVNCRWPLTRVCLVLQLNNWEPGDRAVSEHQRHYPNCRFVRGDRADNVSLSSAAGTVSLATTSQVPAGAPVLTSVSNPSMQQSDERLLTFVNWPSRIPVRPEQLAKAGFYYVGKDSTLLLFIIRWLVLWLFPHPVAKL